MKDRTFNKNMMYTKDEENGPLLDDENDICCEGLIEDLEQMEILAEDKTRLTTSLDFDATIIEDKCCKSEHV
mgnify:CR=1 FL=1